MKILKWLSVWSGLLAITASAGWFYRTEIIQVSFPVLLTETLQQMGVRNFHMELKNINAQYAMLASLTFDVVTKKEGRIEQVYHIKLKDILLQYTPQTMLEGRLKNIVIKNMQITVVDNNARTLQKKRQNQDTTIADIIVAGITELRSDWREKIPFKSVKIDALKVHGKVFNALNNNVFSINLKKLKGSAGNMDLSLQILSPSLAEKLSINFDKKNTINIRLDGAKTAWFNIELTDKKVKVDYQIDIVRFQRLLNKLGLTNNINQFVVITDKVSRSGVIAIQPVSGVAIIALNTLISVPHKKSPARKILSLLKLKTGLIKTDTVELKNVETGLLFNYSLTHNGLILTINHGSFIRYNSLKIASTMVKNMDINLQAKLVINHTINHQLRWAMNGDLLTKTLHISQSLADNRNINAAIKNIAVVINATNKHIDFNGRFDASSIPAQFVYKGQYKLRNKNGKLQIQSDKVINLSMNNTRLSQIISPWPYPFDLVSGKIRIQANMSWARTKAFKLSTTVQLIDAGGMYNKLVFSGLNTEQNLDIFPILETQKSTKGNPDSNMGLIHVHHLDMGVLISNLHLQLFLQGAKKSALPVFNIRNFVGHLFGGKIFSKKITFDFSRPVNYLKFDVSDINLAKMVKVKQSSGLDVSGLIDGELPIGVSAEGLFIKHGYFDNAGRKGYIRYQSKASGRTVPTNSLSTIVLKALQDFEYNKLTANLTYMPDGALSVKLKMRGISPALGKKQRVELNINTEQNVKVLLKSLRYTQGLDEKIDAIVRRKYH